ncbi:hypothetical protein IHE45_15G003800 [Dioscorea alata]|uniref:Uncharacterized protein n=1 Tax=Dioscorea alata TaxID=55571 RepID=A0ACB7UJC2_DIOAL|nr:hypothetical protein IHE45_15G003800 [Dioscorea alata]
MADKKEKGSEKENKPSTALIQKPKPKPELPPGPDCCAQPSYQWLCASVKCASCGMVTMWTKQFYLPPPPSGCHQSHCGCGCGCGCGQSKPCRPRCGGCGCGGGGCARSKPCRSRCGCGQC